MATSPDESLQFSPEPYLPMVIRLANAKNHPDSRLVALLSLIGLNHDSHHLVYPIVLSVSIEKAPSKLLVPVHSILRATAIGRLRQKYDPATWEALAHLSISNDASFQLEALKTAMSHGMLLPVASLILLDAKHHPNRPQFENRLAAASRIITILESQIYTKKSSDEQMQFKALKESHRLVQKLHRAQHKTASPRTMHPRKLL